MSASLLSRVRRLERRGGPCLLCAGRTPQFVVENDPFGAEAPEEAPPCPACGALPPRVVLRYVADFFTRPAEPGGHEGG
jgi:hypothetical protein